MHPTSSEFSGLENSKPISGSNSGYTSPQKRDISKSLENHTFFQNEGKELIEKLSSELQTRIYNDKDTIIKNGDVGRAMFIILKGEVHVVSDDGETTINVLKEGCFFGEIGVLFSVPRTATCRSKGRCVILTLTKQKMEQILTEHPEAAKRIAIIAQERFTAYTRQQSKFKTVRFGDEIDLGLTHHDLKNVPIFRNCEVGFLHMLALTLEPVEFKENEYIVRKGETASEMFFVVRGIAEIVNEVDGKEVVQFQPGSFFGEIGLFFNVPRTVSVKVATPSVNVFKLTMEDLNRALKQYPEIEQKIKTEAEKRYQFNKMRKEANLNKHLEAETDIEIVRERLKNINIFKDQPISFLHNLSLQMTINTYKTSQIILKKGEQGNSMHFVIDGQAEVVNMRSKDNIIDHIYATLHQYSFFGEVALFYEVPRTATVVALTECTTFELSKDSLMKALQEHPELKDSFYEPAKANYKTFIDRRNAQTGAVEAYDISVIMQRLETVPIFQSCEQSFLRELALSSKHVRHQKAEVIVHKGELASAMFFIVKGSVEVISEDNGMVYATVSAGQFFGEIGVLHGIRRTASVRVISETVDILILTVESIRRVAEEYPNTYKLIALEAERRLHLAKTRECVSSSQYDLAVKSSSDPTGAATKRVKFEASQHFLPVPDDPSCISSFDLPLDEGQLLRPESLQAEEKNTFSSYIDEYPIVKKKSKNPIKSLMKFINKKIRNKVDPVYPSSKTSDANEDQKKKESATIPKVNKETVRPTTAYGVVAPKPKVRLQDLDFEIFVNICSTLGLTEQFALRLVCKKWNTMLTEKKAWATIDFESVAHRSNHQMIVAFCGMVGSHLTNLNLSQCWQLIDEDLTVISQVCINIQKLNLTNCWKITDTGIASTKVLVHLTHLNTSYCAKFTGASIEDHNWAKMESVNFTYCKTLSHSTLERIISRTPNIHTFKFRRCNRISDYGIFSIARYLRNLQRLDLSDCDQINDACLKWIGTGCGQLESLNLTFCSKVTSVGIHDLCVKSRKLKQLNASFCISLEDRTGFSLQRLEDLEDLSLRGCRKLTDAALNWFAGLKKLKYIDVSQCPLITNMGVKTIQVVSNGKCRIVTTGKHDHYF